MVSMDYVSSLHLYQTSPSGTRCRSFIVMAVPGPDTSTAMTMQADTPVELEYGQVEKL